MVSLGGAPLSLPSFVTPQFQEFFRLGRVLRTTLPTGKGRVVHLFVVYGYQGAADDADQLQLTGKLLQAVLAEAQVVCIGQPMLIAGDLNADPAVIPCLAKGISAGRQVDLALAFLWVLVLLLMLLVVFVGRRALVRIGISLLGVLMLLLHLMLVMSLIGGLLLIFQYLLVFALMPGWLTLLALWFVSLSGLLVGWILLISPPRRLLVLSRMSGMFTGMSLRWFLMRLFLLLGMLPLGLLLTILGFFGVGVMLKRVYFGLIPKLEVPCKLAALPFLVEVCYGFVAGVWEAKLLAAGVLVSCIGLARVIRLVCIVLSTSLAPVVLFRRRLKSVADVHKGIRSKGFTQSWWVDALLGLLGCCRSSWSV